MKKRILSFMIPLLLLYGGKLRAQCDLTLNNLVIQVVGVPVVLGPNKCQVTFNAQFDIGVNGGFKVLYFHSWLVADYPASPIFNCGSSNAQDPGTNTQLGTVVDAIGKSFLDIGFVNVPTTGALNVVQPLTFSTSYTHDVSVVLTQPSNSPGLTASKFFNGTSDHYTVNNIKVIINTACGGPVGVKTDIWGSNSNAPDPKAQCYICGLTQFFNDPAITGFRNCNPTRQYAVGISTIDPVVKSITYKVYLDVNGNGVLESVGPDILAFTSGTIQVSAPGGPTPDSYSSGLVSLPPPYSNSQPYSEYNYLILVEGPTLSNSVLSLLPNPGCIPLPVDFQSFTATRSRSNVLLKWETMTESNNTGFAVERNTNGDWTQIVWVPTQAANGNSNSLLTYTYNDLNTTKGISQYRIRQVDIDARSKYSAVRSVRGEGQLGTTIVYPNPSVDGKVNILFEDATVTRDISVADMSGRVVKQAKGITNNSITIENLQPGMYMVRIISVETGEQSVTKIVVNKH